MTEKEPLNPEQPQYQIYQLQFPDIRFCLREGKEWKDCKIGISVKDQTCVFALDPNGGNDQQALKALFSALKSAELFLTKISCDDPIANDQTTHNLIERVMSSTCFTHNNKD